MQDFDFCRDPSLFPSQREVTPRWLCQNCGGEYDRTAIELALVAQVHDLERRFAQQDLRCGKCGQIRSDNLSRHCQCSGAYQLTMNKSDTRRKLRTMVNVAIVHNLARLRVGCFSHSCPTAIHSDVPPGMCTGPTRRLVITFSYDLTMLSFAFPFVHLAFIARCVIYLSRTGLLMYVLYSNHGSPL
jgi:hypothetical protein